MLGQDPLASFFDVQGPPLFWRQYADAKGKKSNNIAIIAYMLECDFQCKQSQQLYLYYTIYTFMST